MRYTPTLVFLANQDVNNLQNLQVESLQGLQNLSFWDWFKKPEPKVLNQNEYERYM